MNRAEPDSMKMFRSSSVAAPSSGQESRSRSGRVSLISLRVSPASLSFSRCVSVTSVSEGTSPGRST